MPRGKVFGLLGPNGAGKTTLIRIINRITAPDEGEVTFDGHAFAPTDVMRIGYLPEERGLYKKMKVGEQAVYLKTAQRTEPRRGTATPQNVVREVWHHGMVEQKLEELSKGMQQKVQFIITVLHEPPLLIFDEPFSGFDPVNAEMLKREILELRDKGAYGDFFNAQHVVCRGGMRRYCPDQPLAGGAFGPCTGCEGAVSHGYVRSHDHQLRTDFDRRTFRGDATQRSGDICTPTCCKKAEQLSNSELIRAVAERAELRAISEKMPSMQEIFLRVVGGSSSFNSQP